MIYHNKEESRWLTLTFNMVYKKVKVKDEMCNGLILTYKIKREEFKVKHTNDLSHNKEQK